jgi:selenocysteine lyase/cysteine desulfurase
MTRATTFDVNAIRAQFPALRGGAAHFDGPGGSQTPDTVADAICHAMLSPLANRGTITRAERNAEEIVGQCRRALGDLLNADPDGVIFGRSMTAVTFDLSRTLSATWRSGDEIVVSRLDHDANVRRWIIAADKAGVVVRWADFDPATGQLPVANVEAQLSPRTRLVRPRKVPAVRPVISARRWSRRWLRGDRGTVRPSCQCFPRGTGR